MSLKPLLPTSNMHYQSLKRKESDVVKSITDYMSKNGKRRKRRKNQYQRLNQEDVLGKLCPAKKNLTKPFPGNKLKELLSI